jgi:hypothetical protein
MSLLCFYMRLLPKDGSFMIRFIRGTGLFHCLFALAAVIYFFFSSTPIYAAWDLNGRLDPNYSARGKYAAILTMSSIYVVLDVIIWIIPIVIVWNLQMTPRRRVGVFALFATGGFACAAAIARTCYLSGVYNSWDGTCKLKSSILC